MNAGREATIGRACEIIQWLSARSAPFSKHDLAAEFSIVHRTAYRWIVAADTTGWLSVERRGNRLPTLYRSEIRLVGREGAVH